MIERVYLRVGQILEFQDRIFKIDCLHYSEDGTPGMRVECLTPLEEDQGKVWWSLEINDPESLVLYTVH